MTSAIFVCHLFDSAEIQTPSLPSSWEVCALAIRPLRPVPFTKSMFGLLKAKHLILSHTDPHLQTWVKQAYSSHYCSTCFQRTTAVRPVLSCTPGVSDSDFTSWQRNSPTRQKQLKLWRIVRTWQCSLVTGRAED